ncbi:MAG TPA: AAA family ATPase [Gammaproteobacteria bacterium]|nr:AAA family ATPase [Gammaproteobacteria bacterium]
MSIVEKAVEKLKALQPQDGTWVRVEPPLEKLTSHTPSPATLERLQDKVRAVHAAASKAPELHIDHAGLKRAGLLPMDEEAAHRLADELRRIKHPLLANITGKGAKAVENGQRIMVASAIPGEGKTFTSLNLAMSLAKERDYEVLLVDGDIPKCDLTRALNLEGHPGLLDVLWDEQLRSEDVMVRTDVPNLMVVPVGKPSTLTAELFSSRRMELVLREFVGLSQRRLLIFDSSPLLATSEAQVLASHMGQIILVVAAGRTPQQAVKSAIQTLDDSKCINLILNMTRLWASEGYYGSYYKHNLKDS